MKIENEIHAKAYEYIACIDEVGRGCLLGDVVACAIIMPKGVAIEGVKDSKKLTPLKREKLYNIILDNCIAYGIGRVNSSTIDEINIKESTKLAMKYAIENLVDKTGNKVTPDYLLVDAENVYMDIPQEAIIKGDEKCHGIACASIIAKVYRDRLCLEWANIYPNYGIENHKGYGTKKHIDALKLYGPTTIHRHSFLKKILDGTNYDK